MTSLPLTFQSAAIEARPSGALFWPSESLLCVSDLHFGKAQRYAAHGGANLPPYDTAETLKRLDQDIAATGAKTVLCLGDSFDALSAARDLDADAQSWITRLQAGRRWFWLEGNHDPGPLDLGGTHVAELRIGPLTFRHEATRSASLQGEVSGHYHPKASLTLRGRRITRPCFIWDETRMILPAYGAYTGGLSVTTPVLSELFSEQVQLALIGPQMHQIPFAALRPRRRR